MGKAVEVYRKKTQQVIGRGGNVPDADFGFKPFLAIKVGLHEPRYLFAIQNLSL